MNDFLNGMDSDILNKMPDRGKAHQSAQDSAWRGVAHSFYQTGNNIRAAIKEALDARRKSKQTH
jgi:hypothetical protein